MKVSFIKIRLKGLAKWLGIMATHMKDNGNKDKWMVMVNSKKLINNCIKVILNKIKDMDMVIIFFK